MKKHTFETPAGLYTVELKETDKLAKTGQILTRYKLIKPDGTVLFKGDDLGCSPMHSPESMDNAIALLAFLTGDEIFSDTPEQEQWFASDDREWLSSIVYDYETQE